ncbi:reverse transcriptase domain-containing protein [Tanacetum coccineum]
MEMEIPCSNKIKFITACSFSNDTFEDIMKAQVSIFKASATLNIQAFKIKKSVSISFRMTQVHKTEKDHMMMIRDYDWMMISKKLKDHIQVKLKPKSLKTVGHDAAYEMTWKNLMKLMTEAYCPRNEIQKLENELWSLTVKETDKVERFISGLPDSIQENVTSSKPTRLQEAIEIANSLMDQKNRVFTARQVDNKRRMEGNPRDNYVQQPPYKRQNIARVYTVGPGEKKEYVGTLPLCNKCKYHHTGPCTAKCGNCKTIVHQTKDCRSLAAVTNPRAPVANQRTLTCFECGEQGHYRGECPELKNQNRGNQAGSSEARGKVYALKGGETNQDPSNIADDINA